MTDWNDIETKASALLEKAHAPAPEAAAETKSAPEKKAAPADADAIETDDEALLAELAKEETPTPPPEDEWSALKKMGITPQQVADLLKQKQAPEPRAEGLSQRETRQLSLLMRSNPDAAKAYLEAVSGGAPAEEPLEEDADPVVVLQRKFDKQQRQLEAVMYELVRKEARGYVDREIPQFKELKEFDSEIEEKIVDRLSQKSTVSRENISELVRELLKEEQQKHQALEDRILKAKIAKLQAQKKLHAPSTANPGAPMKVEARKPLRRLSDWDSLTEKAERAFRSGRIE